MNLTELKRKKMGELIHMGSELNIEGVSGMRRQDLIFALLQHLKMPSPLSLTTILSARKTRAAGARLRDCSG